MSSDCIPQIADQYPVESLPDGWSTCEVTFLRRNGEIGKRLQIIDLKTGKRYLHEPLRMTAFKCFLLFFAIPFYTALYMAWNLIRIPTTTFFTLTDRTKQIFYSRSGCEVMQRIWLVLWDGADALTQGVVTVVRAPFYALKMWFGSLVGIFSPLEGRKWLEEESALHQRSTQKDCARHLPAEFCLDITWNSLKEKDCPHTLFLAFCMQPLGNIKDPHILSVEEQIV